MGNVSSGQRSDRPWKRSIFSGFHRATEDKSGMIWGGDRHAARRLALTDYQPSFAQEPLPIAGFNGNLSK